MADLRPFKKFRIKSIEGPFDRGRLNQFHDYIFEVELDPGGPYKLQAGRVGIRFFEAAYFALAADDPTVIPFDQQARARATHYVIETLQSLLQTSGQVFPLALHPTVEEVQRLRQVDITKVEEAGWKEVPPAPTPSTTQIFISCGQSSPDEVALGQAIAAKANEATGLQGFFAQNQHSLDGVTREIFNRLHDAAAFVAVMHRREPLPGHPPGYRGSVWVEQEIAIAAFLVQSLGLRLPSRAYVQKGIRREGVRGFIVLNPTEFETADDILSDLETFWPTLSARA